MQFILICNLVLYAPTWLTTFMSGLFHFNLRGLLYLQFCMRNNIFRLTPKVFQTPSLILLHLRGINNYKLRSDQSNYKLYPLLYEFEYKLDSYIRYTMYLFNWLSLLSNARCVSSFFMVHVSHPYSATDQTSALTIPHQWHVFKYSIYISKLLSTLLPVYI